MADCQTWTCETQAQKYGDRSLRSAHKSKGQEVKPVHGKLPSEAQQAIRDMNCEKMTEKETIEGGQKDVLLRRTNIKKRLSRALKTY